MVIHAQCLGLLSTFYAFETGNLWNCKRSSEANQRTTLTRCGVEAGTKDFQQQQQQQQKCHLFVNLPTQHQICEVNKAIRKRSCSWDKVRWGERSIALLARCPRSGGIMYSHWTGLPWLPDRCHKRF